MREHLRTKEGQRRSVFASCATQTPNSQVLVATCILNCVLLNYSLGLSAWKKIKNHAAFNEIWANVGQNI